MGSAVPEKIMLKPLDLVNAYKSFKFMVFFNILKLICPSSFMLSFRGHITITKIKFQKHTIFFNYFQDVDIQNSNSK